MQNQKSSALTLHAGLPQKRLCKTNIFSWTSSTEPLSQTLSWIDSHTTSANAKLRQTQDPPCLDFLPQTQYQAAWEISLGWLGSNQGLPNASEDCEKNKKTYSALMLVMFLYSSRKSSIGWNSLVMLSFDFFIHIRDILHYLHFC